LCAEDPVLDFLPQTGRVERWRAPAGVRVDHAVAQGMVLSPYYDSMLGKIIAHGATREEARRRVRNALEDTMLFGVATNRAFLARLLDHPAFAAGEVSTAFIPAHFHDPAGRAAPPSDQVWAMAAWLLLQPAQAVPDEWRGFASAGAVQLPVRLAHRGEERSGRMIVARDAPPQLMIDGKAHPLDRHARFVSHRAGERLYLQTGEGEWVFEDRRLTAREAGRAGSHDGRLVAPINARVAQVAAVPGVRVAPGDLLVTLEAMKMEHALTARLAGTVAAVHVAVNDQVAPGKLLVEVAPDAASAPPPPSR
jgi:geranyl-CoA carboxylase alpha subunit